MEGEAHRIGVVHRLSEAASSAPVAILRDVSGEAQHDERSGGPFGLETHADATKGAADVGGWELVSYPATFAEAWARMQGPCRSETWIPLRYVPAATWCWFCGAFIPRAKPGTTTGTRGTKAWLCREREVLECFECRSEAMRAEEAGRAREPAV